MLRIEMSKVWAFFAVILSAGTFAQAPGDEQPAHFKIMGERNSGTRYLQQLLGKNLAIPHLRLNVDGGKLNSMSEAQKDAVYAATEDEFWGWKHACAPTRAYIGLHAETSKSVLFVVTSKNPYSWLLSMWRHPYHYIGAKPTTFDKFLRRPWGIVGRERFVGCGGDAQRHASHQQHFKSPVDMWNRKLRSFAQLAAPHVAKVRYEDLVADPKAIVQLIQRRFGVAPADGQAEGSFANVESSTKTKQKDYSAYKEYYLKEKWKDKWDCAQCLKFTNYGLDDEVLEAWSYVKWPGPGEKALAAKLNGQTSWMLTPKGNNADQKAAQRPPTFVSKATLERQQAQQEALHAHRAQHGGSGHAPNHAIKKKKNTAGQNHRLPLNSEEPSPLLSGAVGAFGGAGGGWSEVAGYRDQGPAHVASGGPMDAVMDARALHGKHRGQAV